MDGRESRSWHVAGRMHSRENRPTPAKTHEGRRRGSEGERWDGLQRAARSAKVTGRRRDTEKKDENKEKGIESASILVFSAKHGEG